MSSNDLKQRLIKGCKKLEITLSDQEQNQLIQYIELFFKWNKAYNLSAIKDVHSMVDRHLLDSLAILPLIRGDNIIDVGTGGGLPGIPLAICKPNSKITLLDSNGKKTRFLHQVKTDLNLTNVTIVQSRVENYKPAMLFDGVVSRAFASLEDMVKGCRHMLLDNGRFWAMKGIYPEDELKPLQKHYIVENSYQLSIPGEPGERHLLEIKAQGHD
jgi:16S rRNA (guanine527-N7)-methyltransferase